MMGARLADDDLRLEDDFLTITLAVADAREQQLGGCMAELIGRLGCHGELGLHQSHPFQIVEGYDGDIIRYGQTCIANGAQSA